MAYKIEQSSLFVKKIAKLLEYLESNWGKKVAVEFKTKLDKRMLQLLTKPDNGKVCNVPHVRMILITPHNKLFYRIKGKTIYIITLFDTRQDPKKNKYE
ncbi:MAG TPA: type II toxin-antitoxin system RelE/ParE family toxin [Hanamia sp.]